MNQKRAKHYRQVARERSVGQPNRAYARAVRGKHRGVCISLLPACTRAEYKRIKVWYRDLRREGAL